MATTFKWVAPEALQTYHTTALNSLADGSYTTIGAAITNETDLYQYINVELFLAALSPTAGAFVDVWMYPTMDATNFASDSNALQTSNLLCTFQLGITASTVQRLVRTNIPIPPLDFKVNVRNKSGVTLSSSNNTLKYRRHNEQGV